MIRRPPRSPLFPYTPLFRSARITRDSFSGTAARAAAVARRCFFPMPPFKTKTCLAAPASLAAKYWSCSVRPVRSRGQRPDSMARTMSLAIISLRKASRSSLAGRLGVVVSFYWTKRRRSFIVKWMNKSKPLQPGGQPDQVEELEREIKRLQAENEGLKKKIKDLEEELRASKRQAAPFSKGQRKANPKRPGRKAGQDDFRHRPAPAEPIGGDIVE